MKKHTIERPNMLPLRFTGDELSSSSTWEPRGESQNRYNNYTLYRMEPGYLLTDEYVNRWQGASGAFEFHRLGSRDDLIEWALHNQSTEISDLLEGAGIEAVEEI